MRRIAALLFVVALPSLGHAIEWWHDPERGCGTLSAWKETHRIKDLPGCSGELPKGAPPAEVAMHDSKVALLEAERLLDARQPSTVASFIDRAVEIMNRAPNDDPRVNWARPHFKTAIDLLRDRLASLQK